MKNNTRQKLYQYLFILVDCFLQMDYKKTIQSANSIKEHVQHNVLVFHSKVTEENSLCTVRLTERIFFNCMKHCNNFYVLLLQKAKEEEELEKQQRDFERDEVLKEKRREEAKRIAEKEAENKRVIITVLYFSQHGCSVIEHIVMDLKVLGLKPSQATILCSFIAVYL